MEDNEKTNPRIIGNKENEDSQFKGWQKTSSTKFVQLNFPNLRKKMTINVQEVYRTSNKLNQKIKSPGNIIRKHKILVREHEIEL